ncbi:DUF4179 domain-containing protein [Ktedonosporobacter rubrisoli]|uniref:DUF4179 domain-containing protein n=1 Tax=Ktedonosporobacter rubrisoli TaxID=2509675 RepID=A0A4P6JX02_KTERU|nr:DUF4179 domain-containing protein [Ktedonosporobacter rubrisoli]QBD80268.1 DUF4179 domain-containing protein [Ktedonosporobacter rubrisoli]
MTHKIEEQYKDLLPEPSDSKAHNLVQDLHAAYTHTTPIAQPRWEVLLARTQSANSEKQRDLRLPAWQPIPKISFSMAAAVVLLLATVVIASAAALDIPAQLYQILGMTKGGSQQLQAGQYTELHLTKTVDGIRVSLKAAYADANMVVVGYTITNNDQNSTNNANDKVTNGQKNINIRNNTNSRDDGIRSEAILVTKQGKTLPNLEGTLGYSARSMSKDYQIPFAWMFDGSTIENNPHNLDLVLKVRLGKENPGARGGSIIQYDKSVSFAFSVPFHKSQVLTPHQRVTVDRQTATLEKVIIAPSGTQLVVSGLAKNYSLGYSTVRTPGKSADGLTMESSYGQAYQSTVFFYTQPIKQVSGKWVFTLVQAMENGGAARKWVFTFVVP